MYKVKKAGHMQNSPCLAILEMYDKVSFYLKKIKNI